MIWAAVRWLPLMFLVAPVMEAPLVAYKTEPIKPIKTWVGNASWYGSDFNGKKTANGERFDSESLTAAHPNLPFGSIVRLVNPRTGQFELVRINDRGPFIAGRCLDLSRAAFLAIDSLGTGLLDVRYEVLR